MHSISEINPNIILSQSQVSLKSLEKQRLNNFNSRVSLNILNHQLSQETIYTEFETEAAKPSPE